MASRAKKLVTLALNKKLADSIRRQKQSQPKQIINKKNIDEDYMPENENTSSDSELEDKRIVPLQKKIKILNDVQIRAPLLSLPVNQNDNNLVDPGFQNLMENKEDDFLGPSTSFVANENSNYIYFSIELDKILNIAMDISDKKTYTKKGEIRKRRIFDKTVMERKKAKFEKIKEEHKMGGICDRVCKKKCFEKISQSRRLEINTQFWTIEKKEQQAFMLHSTAKVPVKRKTAGLDSRRLSTISYTFKDNDGKRHEVCKTFYLQTLGYNKKNDKPLRSVLKNSGSLAPKKDKRGRTTKKYDRQIIIEHIQSFNPTISHYRREHAPNRLYLPSDVTVKLMYDDFRQKHPNILFSYYLYREVVSSMNISFTKLGHEECWACEKFDQHKQRSGHKKEDIQNDCDECQKYNTHHMKYTEARRQYKLDVDSCNQENNLVCSADLQKVIMLPRCDTFKEVIFTPRIIAFNESIVPVGKNRKMPPTAVVWHEAVAGRSKANIISAFYAFFLTVRDLEHVTIWLDNCSAQNKNWCLYSFFIYMINSAEVNIKTSTLKYFEPGHTFMSADSFHHQVETSLKKKGKVYDFKDYTDSIKSSLPKVQVIELHVENFFEWDDHTSTYKLNKINPRPYLSNMVEINFERGKNTLKYKTDFKEPETELNFLTAKSQKMGITKPVHKTHPRGITKERKNQIISKLCEIMPPSRLTFWQELPVSSTTSNDVTDDEL